MNKIEYIEEYKIIYKKHPFSKSIKISLKQDKTILVTMPYFCTYKSAKCFLLSNFQKIKQLKINKKIYDESFKTKFDSLLLIPSSDFKISVKGGKVHFFYPSCLDFRSEKVQIEFSKAYLKALQIEARFYLPDRLNFLAKKYGYTFNKVALRNQKTRFGSCSFNNNINLNINLMSYDFDVIDYVLLHELAHTKVKNHSQQFWNEVEKSCPNYKALRNKLKNCNK